MGHDEYDPPQNLPERDRQTDREPAMKFSLENASYEV
jgi:hypothetical protein